MKIVTIHDRPHDAPDGFAVRHWEVQPGIVTPGKLIAPLPTLAAARDCVPSGLVNIGREPDDDISIVEVWV